MFLKVFNLFTTITVPILAAPLKVRAPSQCLAQPSLFPSQWCHGLTQDDSIANAVKLCRVTKMLRGPGKNCESVAQGFYGICCTRSPAKHMAPLVTTRWARDARSFYTVWVQSERTELMKSIGCPNSCSILCKQFYLTQNLSSFFLRRDSYWLA